MGYWGKHWGKHWAKGPVSQSTSGGIPIWLNWLLKNRSEPKQELEGDFGVVETSICLEIVQTTQLANPVKLKITKSNVSNSRPISLAINKTSEMQKSMSLEVSSLIHHVGNRLQLSLLRNRKNSSKLNLEIVKGNVSSSNPIRIQVHRLNIIEGVIQTVRDKRKFLDKLRPADYELFKDLLDDPDDDDEILA